MNRQKANETIKELDSLIIVLQSEAIEDDDRSVAIDIVASARELIREQLLADARASQRHRESSFVACTICSRMVVGTYQGTCLDCAAKTGLIERRRSR